MQFFCGTDIIEIKRIKEEIDRHGEEFINRIFTKTEVEYCESKKIMRYQHYAVRFAAKEAVFKSISSQLKDKYSISWQDVEITNNEAGRPYVKINNKEIKNLKNIDISLSHCKEYANAVAIAEFNL